MSSNNVAAPQPNMTLERLTSLYELIGRMNSVYELQELLDFVIDRALNLTGGRRGVLLLGDDYEGAPEKVAAILGAEVEEADLQRILTFISTSVVIAVLEKGDPQVVNDLRTDERYEDIISFDTIEIKGIRSVLAVPLKIDEKLVGLIYIDHPRQGVFGKSDLEFLSAFANQAALAINRAREHQRQVEELTLLNELSRSIVQALDLNEVLTRIVSEVTTMLNVEASSVLLLDEATAELTFATSVSDGKPVEISTRLQMDQGIAGWVVTTGELACVNDVTGDKRWYGEVETGFKTNALLCVPLKSEGGPVVGVLEALNKKSLAGFDAADTALLSAFAASATIAIENARLFQEARQAQQLRALNEVAMTLSSTLDLNKILDTGLEQTLDVLKAEAGVINLIDGETRTDLISVQLRRPTTAEPGLTDRQTLALSGVTSWMLGQNISQAYGDDVFVVDEAHPQPEYGVETLAGFEVKALAVAPIKVSGAIRGELAIVRTEIHAYTSEEISLLSSIGRIIGLAAQNAYHYLQMQAQTLHLTYLNEIGSVLTSSLDLGTVLKVIIEGVNSLLQTELTSIFLIDEETNELVLRYSTKGNAHIRLPAPWQGIAGWVATHDTPALVNNTDSDPRHLRQIAIETGYEAHSILCVPLKVEGQIIGVVEVLNKIGGQQFTQYHQSLLVELTKWAAIALHNARLFDERLQAYQRLNAEQQRRVAAEARGAMAAVILDMAHTMNNVVGAIRVWASTLKRAAEVAPSDPLSRYEKTVGQIQQNAEEAIKLMGSMTGPLMKAEIAPTDVHDCLDAGVRSCWWPDNIQLKKNYGEDISLIKANGERLEAVFYNLLSNAVQAMTPDGGEIQLRTHRNAKGWIEVIIADNGPGIPLELQERVFNPGVSGKDRGLGIGLWLVETFIHQFEGQIDFTTSATAGTKFTVSLQPAMSKN
jgi:GAF domain-containing protein/two-component sensor histidine kinase